MLSHQFRELERDRAIDCWAHSVVPPKVEYSLSKLGKSLKLVVKALI
jgi:DNA-binding HxlR family transcriptional regulator